MKLLAELNEAVTPILQESADGKKTLYIEGIFAQAEIGNRNGRIYPKAVLERAIESQQSLIKEKRAMGELNHPNTPSISLDRVSHLVTELNWDGNNIRGKAKILESVPMGAIAAGLINDGVTIGVSTRGLGTVKKNSKGLNEVQQDFRWVCTDLVSDPSAPDAFQQAIYEGAEWVMNAATGLWEQKEDFRKEVKASAGLTLEQKIALFEKGMNMLMGKK